MVECSLATKGKQVAEQDTRRVEYDRRARRLTVARLRGTHTEVEWEAVLERHGHRCAYCGTTDRICKDHIRPVSRGGSDSATNLQPLCRRCNSWKRDRWPIPSPHEIDAYRKRLETIEDIDKGRDDEVTRMAYDKTPAEKLVAQWLRGNPLPTWVEDDDLMQEARIALYELECEGLDYITEGLRYRVAANAMINYLRREGRYHEFVGDKCEHD